MNGTVEMIGERDKIQVAWVQLDGSGQVPVPVHQFTRICEVAKPGMRVNVDLNMPASGFCSITAAESPCLAGKGGNLADEMAAFLNAEYKSELISLTEGTPVAASMGWGSSSTPPKPNVYEAFRLASRFLRGKEQGALRIVLEGGDKNKFERVG